MGYEVDELKGGGKIEIKPPKQKKMKKKANAKKTRKK
jgi:hypothetical protein